MEIRVSPKRITQVFSAAVILLLVGQLGVMLMKFGMGHHSLYGLIDLFDFRHESNFPTAYSAFAILFCSLVLGLISRVKVKAGDRFKWHWVGLALVFLFLALDEAATLHEKLARPTQELFGSTSGVLYFAWVVPYAILVVVFGIAYLRFVFHLPKRTRFLFCLAGGVFVLGALGIELLEAYQVEADDGERGLRYYWYCTAEEFLEMLGIVIFIYATTSYLAEETDHVRFDLHGS